jgi:hypothetical protein
MTSEKMLARGLLSTRVSDIVIWRKEKHQKTRIFVDRRTLSSVLLIRVARYFQTKNSSLGKFWRALNWKMFTYFMSILNILWRFGIFYDHWYILCSFGTYFSVLVSRTKENLATLLLIDNFTRLVPTAPCTRIFLKYTQPEKSSSKLQG